MACEFQKGRRLSKALNVTAYNIAQLLNHWRQFPNNVRGNIQCKLSQMNSLF